MDIWASRKLSNKWLKDDLIIEGNLIVIGFNLLSLCIQEFTKLFQEEENKNDKNLFLIISVTLAKSSHLMLGCFSLVKDGLAQESGALLRPLIETFELLIYLKDDPNRIDQVLDNKLPSAGKIAQKISGSFQELREHLNLNASHFKYEVTSIDHLVKITSEIIIDGIPSHSIEVFKKNIDIVNSFQTMFLFFIGLWLIDLGDFNEDLIDKVDEFCQMSIRSFLSNKKNLTPAQPD